jgi:hypothetical protein
MEENNKLGLVKNTVKNLTDILQGQDRLCLIKFSSEAFRLTPLLCVGDPISKNKLI